MKSKAPLPRELAASMVVGYLAIIALGWTMGRDRVTKKPVPAAAAEQAGGSRPQRPARRTGPPDEVAQQMAAIRRAAPGAERLRATIELANSVPAGEIGQWLDAGWFDVRGGYELMVFQLILKDRWELEEPAAMARWAMKNEPENAGAALALWGKTDREGMMAFLKEQRDFSKSFQALTKLVKSDPDLALAAYQVMVEGSAYGQNTGYSNYFLIELAKKNVAGLEALLEKLPTSEKNAARVAISSHRLQTSFGQELQRLLEQPDGVKVLHACLGYDSPQDGQPTLSSKLLAQLGSLPPEWLKQFASGGYALVRNEPEKWLQADLEGAGMSREDAARLRATALQKMYQTPPEKVIQMMAGMDLPADTRRLVLSSLAGRFASDPQNAETVIASLDSAEEKEAFRRMVEGRLFEQVVQEKLKTPGDWLATVERFDERRDRGYYYIQEMAKWDEAKIGELTERFSNLPSESKNKIAKVLVNSSDGQRNLDPGLRGEVLRYLVNQPAEAVQENNNQGEGNPTGWAVAQYVVQMGQEDPATAALWVQSLPAGTIQSEAQKNLAPLWMMQDPQAAEQWIKSLPGKDQAAVREKLKEKTNW